MRAVDTAVVTADVAGTVADMPQSPTLIEDTPHFAAEVATFMRTPDAVTRALLEEDFMRMRHAVMRALQHARLIPAGQVGEVTGATRTMVIPGSAITEAMAIRTTDTATTVITPVGAMILTTGIIPAGIILTSPGRTWASIELRLKQPRCDKREKESDRVQRSG
jgi:hypothetical protein